MAHCYNVRYYNQTLPNNNKRLVFVKLLIKMRKCLAKHASYGWLEACNDYLRFENKDGCSHVSDNRESLLKMACSLRN